MKLTDVTTRHADGFVRLTGQIESADRGALELWFEYPEHITPFVDRSADPFLPVMLMPCMMEHEPLEIGPALSPRMLHHLPQIQQIIHGFYPGMQTVEVQANPRLTEVSAAGKGVAAFFSMGVDSFYTLLHNADPSAANAPIITHLWHMDGFEVPLSQTGDSQPVRDRIAAIAQRHGKQFLWGRTNVRDVFSCDWGKKYFGPSLISVALSLSAGFRYVLIPGAVSYGQLVSYAGHPLLDPLWASEHTDFIHDGCDATRTEKTIHIARNQQALDDLRICAKNRGGVANCGRCQKCIRTMITLHLVGKLAGTAIFPVDEATPQLARLISLRDSDDRGFYFDENLQLARATNRDPTLTRALERLARRYDRYEAWNVLLDGTPVAGLLPRLKRARAHWHRIKNRILQRDDGAASAPPRSGVAS